MEASLAQRQSEDTYIAWKALTTAYVRQRWNRAVSYLPASIQDQKIEAPTTGEQASRLERSSHFGGSHSFTLP